MLIIVILIAIEIALNPPDSLCLVFSESRMTSLLKDAMGSSTCKTALIAHVSASVNHYVETLQTVQLAARLYRLRKRRGVGGSRVRHHDGGGGRGGGGGGGRRRVGGRI